MQGVTTAIVAFVFVCVVFPHLVKNRPQFYAAVGAVLLIILLDALAAMVGDSAFRVFVYVMVCLLQVGAILLLILAAGGMSARELAGDMARAYEVIRRGEEEREVVIPLSGQTPPAPRGEPAGGRTEDPPRTVHEINWPEPTDSSGPATAAPAEPEPPAPPPAEPGRSGPTSQQPPAPSNAPTQPPRPGQPQRRADPGSLPLE